MGARCSSFFEEAGRLGGLVAKMRLASLAGVTSSEATSGEDTTDRVNRLEGAMRKVRAEFSGQELPQRIRPAQGRSEAWVLRAQLQNFLDLMSQRSLFLGDVDSTVRRIDETSASTLGVARVSTWFLDPARTRLVCADLFESSKRAHSSGVELLARDFAPYFDALESQTTIAAHDAHTDPRTACFTESYLKPLGIRSMLDVPIWMGQKMVGVICHEHVGPARTWNSDDETFASLMACFVALALERRTTTARNRFASLIGE
jgi:hypothetical protein